MEDKKTIEEKLKELKDMVLNSNEIEASKFSDIKEHFQFIRNEIVKLIDCAIEKTENDKRMQTLLIEIKEYIVNPKEELRKLEEGINTQNKIEVREFLEFEKYLTSIKDEFISILEYAIHQRNHAIKRDTGEQSNYNQLRAMLYRFKAQNVSQLMDSVISEGYKLRKELREAFEKSAYRILELTRAGKRSEVFYNIIRIFMARGANVPRSLIEVFKPYYDLQTFQALIYTFLVSILNQEESYE